MQSAFEKRKKEREQGEDMAGGRHAPVRPRAGPRRPLPACHRGRPICTAAPTGGARPGRPPLLPLPGADANPAASPPSPLARPFAEHRRHPLNPSPSSPSHLRHHTALASSRLRRRFPSPPAAVSAAPRRRRKVSTAAPHLSRPPGPILVEDWGPVELS